MKKKKMQCDIYEVCISKKTEKLESESEQVEAL